MRLWVVNSPLACVVALGLMSIFGCSHSTETAGRDELTANVGKYPAGPAGVARPRVGVPSFKVQGEGKFNGGGIDDLAADQMNTLLDASERFTVIERTQLRNLLNEQNMEGIVTPGELAKPGQVRGVDFLLLGKVTNLRVKQEKKSTGFGFAKIGGLLGGADVKNKETVITTDCGVDIRLVNPTNGETWVSNFSEYKRSDSASAMGLEILGANAEAEADLNMTEDDKGKILRLALDDAFRKALPKIDRKLKEFTPASGGATPCPGQQRQYRRRCGRRPRSGRQEILPAVWQGSCRRRQVLRRLRREGGISRG